MASVRGSKSDEARGDIPAYMRDGVAGLHKVVGLADALARLSGVRDLSTRANIERALAEIRVRHPEPTASDLRVHIATDMPPEATRVFDLARRVVEENPGSGLFQSRLEAGKHCRIARFVAQISSPASLPAEAEAAWNVVVAIAMALRVHPRAIRNDRALSRSAARAVRWLSGAKRKAVAEIATLPRVYAADLEGAAVTYAHVPREHGAVAVIVESATEAMVWRHSALTGLRPATPRPWHRDPDIAAVMAASGIAAINGGAACHVNAVGHRAWTQVVVDGRGGGYQAYIQKADGRVDHVVVAGWGTWQALGVQEAAQIAYIFGEPVGHPRRPLPGQDTKADPDSVEVGPAHSGSRFPELQALLENGKLKQSEFTRFEYRVAEATRRKNDSAVLSFLAGLPKDVAQLTRLIAPLRGWDAASNRRFPPGGNQLDAAVAASAHSDPGAVVRAVKGASTRALILAAALRGPWKATSEAIASGVQPPQALHAYAEAVAERRLPPAVLKSLAEWPLSSHHEISSRESYIDFTDLVALAAALWAATPSRPPMSMSQLDALRCGLVQYGFRPPSLAGSGTRTWSDPVLTTAYANSLRRERADVPGSAVFAPGLVDALHFFDKRLGCLGLSPTAREAARCAILVPQGRMLPKLESISEAWHRYVDRMARDRQSIVHDLTIDEANQKGLFTDLTADEYPTVLTHPVIFDGVMITPLRSSTQIEREADEMANCLLSYCDDARVGALCLFRLESRSGRSTLGLEVHGFMSCLEVNVFQHGGPQHLRVDAPPPPRHAKSVSALVAALNRDNGGPGGPDWRERLSEARRAHAVRASLRPSESELSPARQRQLAAFDLLQLRIFMNKKQRLLDLDAFKLWAEGLSCAHQSRNE